MKTRKRERLAMFNTSNKTNNLYHVITSRNVHR